jgi:hypothetical protein
MPQLIAMIIVIVAAMIYMFQTFGGTGDKITAVAKKSVVLTEINSIKNGVSLANDSATLESTDGTSTNKAHTLEGLATLGYFDSLINAQITGSADNTAGDDNYNIYKAISFGGDKTTTDGDLEVSLVVPTTTATATDKPGIFVNIGNNLASQAGFIEAQLAVDLASIAHIDRNATATTDKTSFDSNGTVTGTAGTHSGTDTDGKFTIYFKDIKAGKL